MNEILKFKRHLLGLFVILLTGFSYRPLHSDSIKASNLTVPIAPLNKKETNVIVTFAGIHIPYLLEEGGEGLYNQFYNRIAQTAMFDSALVVMPIKRAQRAFLTKQVDCLFVGARVPTFYAEAGKVLISQTINNVYLKAYTRSGDQIIENANGLKGKILVGEVGALQNLSDFTSSPFNSSLLPVNSTEQAFAILAEERADVVIAFTLDAELYLKQHPELLFQVSEDYFVFSNQEVVICHDAASGQKVIDHTNQIVEELSKQGQLESMFRLVD